MEEHTGNTFIGRIEKVFDLLGYHLTPQGLPLAINTVTGVARTTPATCAQT